MSRVIRSGVQGQKWGHRYHQSYEVKPTRSGMVGEEHGDAAKRSDKNYDQNMIRLADIHLVS